MAIEEPVRLESALMRLRENLLAYRWTLLIGAAFLGALGWSVATLNELSDLFVPLCFLCFLVSIIVSIVVLLTHRNKVALYRILLNVLFCLLLSPAISLGVAVRSRIFLSRLPRFREITEILIKREMAGTERNLSPHLVPLPVGYSDLNVADRAEIISTRDNITVRFLTKTSNSLAHGGYMYRSDDSETSLSQEYPKTGYTRLAPHWFFFAE